jgi:16S rRNA (uracil1498-N3)-methyltransferase
MNSAMAPSDCNARRLFVGADLEAAATVALNPGQVNYVKNVLRLKEGDRILVFNGRAGEWQASIADSGRRGASLRVGAQVRPQEEGPDIDYLFAPLKRARLDYLVQKATEMGVARLRPVVTRRTTPQRLNLERMRANAIEAAEQCGILRIPEVTPPQKLETALADWDPGRALIVCDAACQERCPFTTLARVRPGPLALLVGPEGGFEESERAMFASKPFATRISLGPRTLRADTAAVAALALVNAVLGDWR